MRNSVGVLLIGIGGYGEKYISAMLDSCPKEARLSGIVDPFISRSPYEGRVRELSVPVFDTLEEFFSSSLKADLAIISSPIHTHYDYVLAALSEGCSVLCEKPVTMTEARMRGLIDAEKKSGHFVAVGFQDCYESSIIDLKNRIVSREFGRPVAMRAIRLMRRGKKYYRRTAWAGKLTYMGQEIFDSPVSNACAHQIQMMLYLSGNSVPETSHVASVEGLLMKARPDIENFDAAAIKISTEENVPLYFYTAHSVEEKKIGPYMVAEFEKAKIMIDDKEITIEKQRDGRERIPLTSGEGLRKLSVAVSSVASGLTPPVTLASSIEHIRCVEKCQGLPVHLMYDAMVRSDGDDEYWAIEGLEEMFIDCFENGKIPGIGEIRNRKFLRENLRGKFTEVI